MKKTKQKQSKSTNNRKIIGFVMLCLSSIVLLLMGIRLSFIMVKGEVDGQDLQEKVEDLYTDTSTVYAERGSIYDRNGNPIAIDANTYDIKAVLTDKWSNSTNVIHVTDPQAVATVLAKHIQMNESDILSLLNSENDQVEFGNAGRNLTYDQAQALKEELAEKNLTGIDFQEEQGRFYPNGVFASHIVGLAKNNEEDEDNQLDGVMGVELEFDDELTGDNGRVAVQTDSDGYVIPTQRVHLEDSVDGEDVYLTLDRRLQIYLENIMTDVEEAYQPTAMTATLMNAGTGEIIAASQRPTFNSTTKDGIDNSWQNLLVEYEIEPGSTMKILTLAAAIEEGVFHPQATFMSGTRVTEFGTVSDVNKEGWGQITYLEGLGRSSNILFAELVEQMGLDTWKAYLDAYGFGQKTGIELPNEYSGSNPYDSVLQQLNTSFGQGITVTPVQLLQAVSAVANGGDMVQPRIVTGLTETDSENQDVHSAESSIKDSPISPESAQLALAYLNQAAVESDFGTSRSYDVEGTSIAAKTGTAQLIDPETGLYYTNAENFNYSVISMFPAEDPEYILYITVQQPDISENSGHGVVLEVYHPFMNRILDYLKTH